MKISKRFIAAFLAVFGHKSVMAIGAGAGATAAITASSIGGDPMPWMIGAASATVVYAYKLPDSKSKVLANGVICVFLGGVGAPFMGQVLARYIDPVYANEWLLAGILGAGWPWLLPIGLSVLKRRGERIGNGQ